MTVHGQNHIKNNSMSAIFKSTNHCIQHSFCSHNITKIIKIIIECKNRVFLKSSYSLMFIC